MNAKLNKLIIMACNNDYVVLEELLKNCDEDDQIHDLIARIGIKSRDENLLRISNHHPRLLMEEYAKDEKSFCFLVNVYAKTKFLDNFEIPFYVWNKVTLQGAKLFKSFNKYPYPDDLKNLDEEIRKLFKSEKIKEKNNILII